MTARPILWLICAAVLAIGPVSAQDTLIRPKPRPAPKTAVQGATPLPIVAPHIRPLPRPANIADPAATPTPAVLQEPLVRPLRRTDAVVGRVSGAGQDTPFAGLRPAKRPKSVEQAAMMGVLSVQQRSVPAVSSAPRKGSVCGDRAIRGEKIKPITSKVKGCGVPEAVRVTEVAGIRLTQAVTVECSTVTALKDWIETVLQPTFAPREVIQLRIAAHYTCRGRNNKKGARLSEHSKGKALDISGFLFSDGSEWSVARDYNAAIKKVHKGACGIFGTTLGPGSDGYHEDHLHFDTAHNHLGPYCR